MDLRTYRAKSLAEALRLVRDDLGPEASVLHTRQVGGGAWKWLIGGPEIEVTASNQLQAPAILRDADDDPLPRADLLDFRSQFREHLRHRRDGWSSPLEELIPDHTHLSQLGLPALLARMERMLLAQQFAPDAALRLILELRNAAEHERRFSWRQLCQQLVQLVAGSLAVRPPVRLLPATRRIVALVGPTGVGKTTTLAKLAAGFRAREAKRVGLITVDTFRVAAIEQLRTYAQIMDLPMEVVASPREMCQALARMQDVDLVLIDTAGRSPRDERQINQLADLLAAAQPDETHLVLSSGAAPASLSAAMETFSTIGASAMVLTKIDEVPALGSLFSLLCNPRLPVSYLTDGQNVPHDIGPADRHSLAALVVGQTIAEAAAG